MLELLKPSDQITVVGKIDPDALAPGTVTSGWIKASDYPQFLAAVQVGDFVTSGVLDAKLEQATSAAGAGAKDVTGSAITQLTEAGGDDDKIVLINIDPRKLDVENEFDYFRLSMTGGVADVEVAGLILGLSARYGLGVHIAAVDEVVAP
jgi:hypothetical protein